MKLSLKEVIDFIDPTDFEEGMFNKDIELPGGRSVNLYGFVSFNGRHIQTNYDSEPYFKGNAEVNLVDWSAYDRDCNEIEVIHQTWFETKLANLLA